jgi:hypothetical protein
MTNEGRKKMCGAHAWMKAKLRESQSHFGVVSVQPHVARERNSEARADGTAVDSSDDRDGKGAKGQKSLVECAHYHSIVDGVVAATVLQKSKVATSTKALALTSEYNGAKGVHEGKRGNGSFELAAHGDGQVVQRCGTIER